ncbi:MAG: DNA damage-inducible protein D [Phycisphaerales bacterium]|nr:DNA damage-inducible protein D [Phycisphaerales bacterium]MCI0630607.1 DNA damage-inducible protein D [Phycisphaerales bacterium]
MSDLLSPSGQENPIASPFDRIRRFDPDGSEFWSSRDLAVALDYVDYRNFQLVIGKAKEACANAGQLVEDHFVDITEKVRIGSGALRESTTILMSRYGCYLTAQYAESTKESVALAKTYFAIQTRRQEIQDAGRNLENDRRLQLREEMKKHNYALAGAAKGAGVQEPKDYAIFQNSGYMGLYGGETMQTIHRRKGLKPSQQILDHMGSTELAANLFRATQTEEKIRREGISGKENANKAHMDVGKKVRQTMKDTGGTLPENLPTPKESINKLKSSKRKQLKNQKPT